MKTTAKKLIIVVFTAMLVLAALLAFAGCSSGGGDDEGGDTAVTLISVTANGSASQTTTQLTLTFDKAINGLTAADITLSGVNGVTKGTLSGSNPYTLPISGFTASGTLSVTVSKTGYTISGSPKTVAIYFNNSFTSSSGIEMISIPAGTFTMGSPASEAPFNSDETQHSVTLSAFSMGKYEVTQEQWVAVMGSNPSWFTTAVEGESGTPGKLPVECVSWYDVLVFCNKLSVLEGLAPVYSINGSTDTTTWGVVPTYSNSTWNAVVMDSSKNGYRLPTEAEWEYACRAGTTTAFNNGNNDYTNSSSISNVAWWDNDSGDKTHQVGLKTANAWGLYDMHGNVWEWCWDWYGDYPSGAQTNPTGGPSADLERVERGGGWDSISGGMHLRSAARLKAGPSFKDDSIGFRLVRSQ